MTINHIKTQNIKSSELLTLISSSSIQEAIEDTVSLNLLASEYGMSRDYAKNFVLSMIDYICNSFHRVAPMGKEDREELAEIILRRNGNLTISDCRVFADMVVACEINTGTAGRDEYKLIDVNKVGILDKLRVYKARRADIMRRAEESFKQTLNSSSVVAPRPLTEYMLTHDYEGNVMPEDWDAERYWRSNPSAEELDEVIIPRIKQKMAAFYADKCNNN